MEWLNNVLENNRVRMLIVGSMLAMFQTYLPDIAFDQETALALYALLAACIVGDSRRDIELLNSNRIRLLILAVAAAVIRRYFPNIPLEKIPQDVMNSVYGLVVALILGDSFNPVDRRKKFKLNKNIEPVAAPAVPDTVRPTGIRVPVKKGV